MRQSRLQRPARFVARVVVSIGATAAVIVLLSLLSPHAWITTQPMLAIRAAIAKPETPRARASAKSETKREAKRKAKHNQADALVDVASLDDRFILDIRYATNDNFFNQKVYEAPRCILLAPVAERMLKAQRWLDEHHRNLGLRLMFKDCYRPNHVQFIMWKAVAGTPKARYVANPHTKTGSIHSYGAAVDLTLADAEGRELDMGTPYDFLGRLAEPRHEAAYLADGKLTPDQVQHRRILRSAMVEGGGMHTIPNEWWHFNAAPAKVIRTRHRRLDVPFSNVPTGQE
ncbi:MAG: M15 family metallopeptidase [Deltaproteobacteria bacterium]|nr:M15 family metallopeptidase [Deltaproteobacteria bacterium]